MNYETFKGDKSIIGNERGFTLIELMITALVVVAAVVSFMGATTALANTNTASYQRNVAIQDANLILEQMRDLAASGTFPGNVTGTFANNSTDSSYTNLPSETITISYADAAANPLDATIQVSYQENSRRSTSVSIRSYITQRA